MDSNFAVPVAHSQDMNNESGQVEPHSLRVSVILRTIMQHFSTYELLELALVNKFWSYEARSLLRDRGSLALGINQGTRSCEDLRALASTLRRTKAITGVLPFSGLTIDVNGVNWTHTGWCTGSPTTEMNEIYDDILSQIAWKSLAVEFFGQWTEKFINCSGFVLVRKLLEEFGSILEVLWLTFPSERVEILHQVLQSCNFPRLVTLRIENSDEPNEGYTSWIKTIVTRAPNLKLLETFNYVDLSENLLEGSSAVHITGHPYSVFRNEIPENLVGTFRMTFMNETEISQDFQLDRFNRIASRLLEVSRSTLSWMHIDVLFLVPLTAYGVCLENVTTLEITINPPKVYDEPEIDDPQLEEEDDVQQALLRLAKTFDFTRIFPNLKAVKLKLYSEFDYFLDGIQEMIERAKVSFVEPLPGRAVNIKNLKVECSWEIDHSCIQLITEMFPDVEELSVQGTEIPFDRIWESWPHLKALDVKDVPIRSVVRNLDSVFCGIFPEEVAQLRGEDEEYLRSVNIVPAMPSITCLKDLRTLNFKFSESSMGPLNDPTYLFSKVTGLIAFQRCPALTVTLTTRDEGRQEALSHLSSYATIL